MWGANDPDERKPIWWDNIEFEDESSHPFKTRTIPPDKIGPDNELLEYYKKLIQTRLDNPVLAFGDVEYILQDDERMLFGYARRYKEAEAIAVFNLSDEPRTIEISVLRETYIDALNNEKFVKKEYKVKIVLEEGEGKLLLNVDE